MAADSPALRTRKVFRDLIPPLGDEERQQLESNLISDGCRDPLVIWGDTIVDGHNRYDICRKRNIKFRTKAMDFADDGAACIWIIQNQFGRRNLAPYTRAELALKLEPLIATKAKEQQVRKPKSVCQNPDKQKPIDTKKELAKVSGLSHDTIAKAKLIEKHADEETKQKLRTNKVSIHRVAKDIKEKQQREARKEKRVEAASTVKELDSRIIIGDFRKHADKIADGSLSLIFTDPPYDRKASAMLPELAAFAAAKLADGGSLICYVGQTQLPTAMDAFRQSLRYWWTIACIHAGRSTVMREYGINAGWKAVLWFVKGTRNDNSRMVADVMSGGEEKSHHDWQQSESEAAYWIERLTDKGDLICDPFLGGGTTAKAAEKLGRRWIGFEIDADNARISSGRISA